MENAKDINELPKDEVKTFITNTCKIGQGAECCRYLVCGTKGMECGRLQPKLAEMIDGRVSLMNAKGQNCKGFGIK